MHTSKDNGNLQIKSNCAHVLTIKTKMAAAQRPSDPLKNPSDMLNMTSSYNYIPNIKLIS